MVIEKDARRFITEAAEAEDALSQIETAIMEANKQSGAINANTLAELKNLHNQGTTNLI